MPINYSKWDSFTVSSDEEEEPQSRRRPDKGPTCMPAPPVIGTNTVVGNLEVSDEMESLAGHTLPSSTITTTSCQNCWLPFPRGAMKICSHKRVSNRSMEKAQNGIHATLRDAQKVIESLTKIM